MQDLKVIVRLLVVKDLQNINFWSEKIKYKIAITFEYLFLELFFVESKVDRNCYKKLSVIIGSRRVK